MKLNLKKLLSLLLAACMAFSLFACGSTEDNSSKENSEKPEPAVRTDDDRFTDVKTAVTTTDAYVGPLTMVVSVDTKQTSPDWETGEPTTYSMTMNGKASLNPATNAYYTTSTNTSKYGEEEESSTNVEKVFAANGNNYLYEKNESIPASDWDYEEYTQMLPRSVAGFYDMATGETRIVTTAIMGGAVLADNYKELVSAYANVFPAAVANTIAQADANEDDTFNEAEGDLLEATPIITLVEENNVITLSIISEIKTVDASEEGNSMVEILFTRQLSVKDGKISSVLLEMTMNVSSTMPAEEGEEPVTQILQGVDISMGYTMDYTFDQAGYDAIAVTLPDADEITVETQNYDKDLTVMFGDVAYKTSLTSYAWEPSIEDAFSNLSTSIESNFNDGALTIEGLYLDKELTTPLNPATMTEDEYFALETIYAKYTIAEGYFMYVQEEVEESDLSKPYQIVMGDLSSFDEGSYSSPYIEAVASYADGFMIEEREGATIWINGVQTTESSFTPVSGTIYRIVLKTTLTDATFTVTHLTGLMGLLM